MAYKLLIMPKLLMLLTIAEMPPAEAAPKVKASSTQPLLAEIKTSVGTIRVELLHEHAPVTVANFVELAKSGFYNNTAAYRIVPAFGLFFGDPNNNGTGGPGYTIDDEIDPKLSHNVIGTLSMATEAEHTGGSRFFINVVPTLHLDGKQTIFGRVVEGMDELIKVTKGKPDKEVEILSVVIDNNWYTPVPIDKVFPFSDDDVELITRPAASRLLKAIYSSENLAAFSQVKFDYKRTRGRQVQVAFSAVEGEKATGQILIMGTIRNKKFEVDQFQFSKL